MPKEKPKAKAKAKAKAKKVGFIESKAVPMLLLLMLLCAKTGEILILRYYCRSVTEAKAMSVGFIE